MTKYFNADPIGFFDDLINTNIPSTAIKITDEVHQYLMMSQSAGNIIQADDSGNPISKPPLGLTKQQIIFSYENAAQKNLDDIAREWGYKNFVTAASYVASTNSQFKADAEALIAWRDAYWVKAYSLEAGKLPATAAEFVAKLPAAPTKPTA